MLMQVVVQGLLLQYHRSGTGKCVVLLHGWGDNAAGLQSLELALSKHYDVITPDLPGFGGSQHPNSVWGLDDYADIVAALLKKLAVKQVYAIVGHSNGGAIAIRGLATHILSAERLVLLASSGIRGTYKGKVKAVRYITKFGKALTMPLPKNTKKRLRQKVYDTVGSDMLVAEHLQETFKKVVTDDVRPDAKQLTQPTLLMYGEADKQTPSTYGEIFHQLIPNATLEILPGADHFLHQEQPTKIVQSIESFLATS